MTHSLQENVNMNPSNNPSISEVLDVHLSRRKILKMGSIASAIALLPSAFISPNLFAASSALPRRMTSLDFTAVPFSTTDTVVVPKGYRASPFYLWGDPVGIDGNSPAFKSDASNTAEEQAAQAGMNHDGMAYFPLENGNEHGLLVMNHEYVDNGLLFPDGDKTWNADKVKKSQNAMGISIIEVKKNNSKWEVVHPSKYARRITPHTPMHLTGPARGNKLMQTATDPYVKGNVYCTLTNNSQRGKEGKPGTDKANPRDKNEFDHIIRWQEAEGKGTAEKFTWNIFALAGNNEKGQGNIKGDAFGSPDGLHFAPNGVLWVQTDVSSSTINKKAYEGMGNNQMLAVIPEEGRFKRFLTGPNGCEITGIAFTPDNKTMFINIQHSGEPDSGVTDPTQVTAISIWPDASGKSRPRSGTVVIQKDNGGMIGS